MYQVKSTLEFVFFFFFFFFCFLCEHDFGLAIVFEPIMKQEMTIGYLAY